MRKTGSDGPVLAFDLASDGHHPSYLQYLTERWRTVAPGRELLIAVAPDFPERHPGIVTLSKTGLVRFATVPKPTLAQRLPGLLGPLGRGVLEWRALARLARRERAAHAVVMYIDQMLQGPIALQLGLSCPVSGIYFRPAFHYGSLGQAQGPSDKRRALRQKLTLRAALRHRRLDTLWTLDPYAVEHLRQLGPARVEALADPVPEEAPPSRVVNALALRYGLRASKTTTLLLFGALTERKGVLQALAASALAARRTHAELTVLLVGRLRQPFQTDVDRAVESAEKAGVRVVREHGFVPEAEVQAHFALADIVLAPYQRHVGSSGIAIRAARSGKPLLASSYGMLGEAVRRERLGVAVDATRPHALAAGLEQLLGATGASVEGMASFAARNTAARFVDAIIDATC